MPNLKKILKLSLFGICLILTIPLSLMAYIEKKITPSEELFVCFGQFLALFPGIIGSYLRTAYYFFSLNRCSWEIRIGFGSYFTHRGASMDANASMGSYCVIGSAQIGKGVMMASHVSIPSGKRQHFDATGGISSEPRFDKVTIGAGCWIGEGAIILADVGSHCIVSAGTVVINNMPDGQLIAGNPGKPIRALKQKNADYRRSK
ncbi:MAG: acyltransferase [Gammaproteobacteria bacterium]